MTTPRRRWMSLSGLLGGTVMFASEAAIVAGFAAVAWLLSIVILSII